MILPVLWTTVIIKRKLGTRTWMYELMLTFALCLVTSQNTLWVKIPLACTRRLRRSNPRDSNLEIKHTSVSFSEWPWGQCILLGVNSVIIYNLGLFTKDCFQMLCLGVFRGKLPDLCGSIGQFIKLEIKLLSNDLLELGTNDPTWAKTIPGHCTK